MIVSENALNLVEEIAWLLRAPNAYDFVVLANHRDLEVLTYDRWEAIGAIFNLASRSFPSTLIVRDSEYEDIGRIEIDLATTPFAFLIEWLVLPKW